MQPLGAPPAKPATSGCGKWAIGCAIGCGALMVVLVIAGGVGSWWMVRPGKQHATAAVLSPQASGAFAVGDLGGDAGVTALLDNFVLETQRQQQRDAPQWVRQMQQMSAASGGSPSASLRMFLPRQATISLEPSAEGSEDPAVVAALNPRGFTKVLHFMMARGDNLVGEHRGHDVLQLSPTAWASLVGGTLLVASEEKALYRGIDRFLDGRAAAPPPPVDLGLPSRPWDLTGALDEGYEGAEELLWGDEPAPLGVKRSVLGVDVATSDRTNGRVALECESAEAAAAALVVLDRRVAERAQRLAQRGMELRAASRVEGNRAVVDWELTGVDAAVAAWLAEKSSAAGEYEGGSVADEPSDGSETSDAGETSDATEPGTAAQ
jgi:hypothetical protein